MELKETSNCLAELGNETRLSIFQFLVKIGKLGATVGDIQDKFKIAPSTLSHHISRLAKVGLIEQKREGRTLHCIPQYKKLQKMIDFLIDECCEGVPCIEKSKCCD